MNRKEDSNSTVKFDTLETFKELNYDDRQPCLLVLGKERFGTVIPITTNQIVLGRSGDAVVVVGKRGVSARHAEFVRENDCVVVTDLNSTNGVFVNRKKVKSARLIGGEKIVLGLVSLEFQYLTPDEIKCYESIWVDPIVGAYTKAFFLNHAPQVFNTHMGRGLPFSLLMIDMDKFKKINDIYSHKAGDYVLATFGEIVREHIREGRLFFRFGGDEFIVILPNVNSKLARQLAERIRVAINDCKFEYNGRKIPVTISIGVSDVSELSEGKKKLSKLVDLADKKLYEGKDCGRNIVRY